MMPLQQLIDNYKRNGLIQEEAIEKTVEEISEDSFGETSESDS